MKDESAIYNDIKECRDYVNLLIFLSAVALMFSALLSEQISLSNISRWILAGSWFLFIVSIVFGVFTRRSLFEVGRVKAEREGDALFREINITYFIQMSGFVFGVVSLTICTMWPLFTQILKK